jgi:hypothetical protein
MTRNEYFNLAMSLGVDFDDASWLYEYLNNKDRHVIIDTLMQRRAHHHYKNNNDNESGCDKKRGIKMTVKELKEILNNLPDDMQLDVCQEDHIIADGEYTISDKEDDEEK